MGTTPHSAHRCQTVCGHRGDGKTKTETGAGRRGGHVAPCPLYTIPLRHMASSHRHYQLLSLNIQSQREKKAAEENLIRETDDCISGLSDGFLLIMGGSLGVQGRVGSSEKCGTLRGKWHLICWEVT